MKIFGIGLSKTGTSSLARALEILGYRTKDYPGIDHYVRGDLSASINTVLLDEYEAFTDTPIPSFYRELDARYPDSKFILTTRYMDGWLKSCRKQFTHKLSDKQNRAHSKLFMDLYGCTAFDEEKFVKGYEHFVAGVLQHFADRPDDLLVMDITGGDGWNKLCLFLGRMIPDVPFPKANVTAIRWMNIDDINTIARQAGHQVLGIYCFLHPDPGVSGGGGVGIPRALRYLVPKLMYRLTHDMATPTIASRLLAQEIIGRKLNQLNPQIPIVFPDTWEDLPYAERSTWNHFWLVDALNCKTDDDGREADFTVSISLIEDRVPILGVVYLPGSDTTYYSISGKGAYMIKETGEPIPLDQILKRHGSSTQPRIKSGRSRESRKIRNAVNTTLNMCLVAAGEQAAGHSLPKSMEWETAAAQAILEASGLRVLDCQSREPVSYNKEKFVNDCIIIE